MTDSRPALQLLNQVFSEQQLTQYADLGTYLEKGGSIFPLVEKGVQGLVRDYCISPDDARQFLRRANSMAIYVRRQFIEHSLHSDKAEGAGPRSGLLSMVDGPSFERLFSPRFDSLCPPDALESLASPVAYLIELLRWIEQHIESLSNTDGKLLLHDRRKDLKLLAVDFNAVHRSVSSVDIIVSVLETFIKAHQAQTDLEQAMIEARYPNGLPYYQHWVTLDAVARHHGLSVGNFAHMVDITFPYFLQDQAWDNDAGRALAHASRLGPYQRQLLTEGPPALADKEKFYIRNFGTDELTWQNLNQVPFFGERTKLDTPGLEALLSVRSFAPVRSANVTYPESVPAEPESGRSGSVYLNANTHPAVSITGVGDGPSVLHRLTADPSVAIGLDRYDRMNRKLRLDQWLELPSEQVDALLVAAIRAEVRGGAQATAWRITERTVHALGLFQSLRERYKCTAQEFAVFIDELSIYGRGEALSQFDQVFNGQGNYPQPLKLDGNTFPVLPTQGVPDLTVIQICNALVIDLQTYSYLALAIAGAQGVEDNNLLRNAATLSSFYRLVKLPRLLGITPVEGVLMLTLLGGKSWLDGLAGAPRINPASVNTPDALTLIYAMHSCAGWCADRNIPVLWMLQQVSEPQALAAASDKERQLFEQVRNLLSGALFTNAALLMTGVPALPGASWLDLLTALVDPDGLVVAQTGTEADYLDVARLTLDQAVKDGLGESNASVRAGIVEKMLTVLLQARETQVSVVKECLAVYAGVNAEQALLVLAWANATVYRLLRQVIERMGLDLDESVRGRNEQPDPLLKLLADVHRRSAVVAKLDLGAELLQDYLDYGHKAWLGQDDKHAFTVRTLYYLTSLARAFELSKQPAQKLLDYLREVNALPDPLGEHATRLAQQAASIRLAEFFDWSVQEVRECVGRIDPQLKVLKNLTQLDLLMRVRVLATHTGMDALTIFLIGTLPEAVDKPAYNTAAEHALLSLSETLAPVLAFSEDLKQLVTMTCTVDNTEVVANKPEDKITFTVTLTDINEQPLSGVNVYWSAALGSIATAATEPNGTVKAQFIPGKVMGTDTPLFWLDLFEPQYADTINVIADHLTLQFPQPLMARVPLGAVAFGEEIELYATLMDSFKNLGKNSLVRWTSKPLPPSDIADASLIIRPAQAYTNQEGLTRVFVSSPTGGKFEISVLSEVAESRSHFAAITFDGEEAGR
ncbi:Tc toxin subunit A [Pseudomonas sp. ANT_J28]|uniref:Tc toxin subunit A n=1 Tax=Pseudomonas sp. ANT_J28 TaxID=2597352 RepID=UPI0011F29988|nr:Tc toxin subunit A [Pseudomonas sp. ANT_J28]KAA0986047.1 virulence plasmid 28 protein [Pseudomonas sp. ANT_J28]